MSDQPLSKQDHCLQLENTLKLLKNYLKKQILNYDFSVPSKDRLGISSNHCKAALSEEFRWFKVQTSLQAVAKSNLSSSGPVHRQLFRAFRRWKQLTLTEKLQNTREQVAIRGQGLTATRLAFLCSIFKDRRLKSHFEVWKNDCIARNETF